MNRLSWDKHRKSVFSNQHRQGVAPSSLHTLCTRPPSLYKSASPQSQSLTEQELQGDSWSAGLREGQ